MHYLQPQVHRGGGWGGEETVEISGSMEAKTKAQKLINDLITPQAFRGGYVHIYIIVLCKCNCFLLYIFQEFSTPLPAVSTSPLIRGEDKGHSCMFRSKIVVLNHMYV